MPLPTTANTDDPQARGFGVRLDDLLLRLAEGPERKLVIQDAQMEAERVNTAQTPEAFLSAFGDVFARADFWGGEGLRFAHRRENLANAGTRFWISDGVEVSRETDRASSGVRLNAASDASELGETHASSDTQHLTYRPSAEFVDGKLYLALDNIYRTSTEPLAGISPQFSDEDPYAGETKSDKIVGTAVIGRDTYAALGSNGIHRDSGGDGNNWSHWNDLATHTNIWAVKGRILAADFSQLYEVTSGGAAPSPLKTLVDYVWTDATDAGAAVLACAENWTIYSFALNDSDALVEQAQTDLGQEVPTAITAERGLIFYTTRRYEAGLTVGSLWQAELSSQLTVVNSQLLRSWEDDAADRTPSHLVSSGGKILADVTNENGASTSLWHYDLADGAMVRDWTRADTAEFLGLTAVEGRVFTWDDRVGVTDGTLYREEADTHLSSGYLIGPAGDLFAADDKSWVTAKLDATDLAGNGEQVDFYLTTNLDALDDPNHADWNLIKSYTDEDDSEIAVSRFSRYIAGMVKLTPSTDGTSSPQVRSFAFRSYPGPGDLLIDIPVNVSDQISSPGRRTRRVQGWGKTVLNELLNRSGREATLELYRHGITITGLVERVQSPSPEVGEAGSPQAYATVRFRGRKATLTTT